MLIRLVPLAIAAALVLAGCTGNNPESATSEPPSSASPSTPVASPEPSPELEQPSEGVTVEMTDTTVSVEPVATMDDNAETSAETAAVNALTAFAHPELPKDEWWAALEPHLTDYAAEAYYYVDPSTIPVSAVTGTGTLVASESALVAVVDVPTNAGTYEVLMIRDAADSPWRAERLTPPRS